MAAGLPGARTRVVIQRTTTLDQSKEPTIAFYITSRPSASDCARHFTELARGHWRGSESRNQRVRDACMREDKTHSKNCNLNCNHSGLRVGLVALKADLHPEPSWPQLQERCQHNPRIPFQAIIKHRSKRKDRGPGKLKS